MAYSITNSDGSVAISIADSVIDSSTYSVDLIGQNASNYGPSVAKNNIRLLENFASETAPSPGSKLTGQLWYDKAETILKIWNGSSWKRIDTPVLASAPSSSLTTGTKYFNTKNNQEYTYTGSTFRLSNHAGEISSDYSSYATLGEPQNSYGTKLKTIYLKDSAGTPRAVLALVYVNNSTNASYQGATAHPGLETNETIMAIFSDDAFTVGNSTSVSEGQSVNYYSEFSATAGIGTSIQKGMNLRSEYSQTSVPLSDLATVATTANAVYSSSQGINITANPADNNYFYSNIEQVIPAANNTYDIGSSSKAFQTHYVGQIVIGNSGGTTGTIVPTGNNTVEFGSITKQFKSGFFHDLTVSGDVTFAAGVQNLGSSSSPVENFYAENNTLGGSGKAVTINSYVMPVTGTAAANTAILTDGSNNLSFQTIPLTTTQMIAGDGLTGGGTLAASRTFNIGAGSYINVNANDIEVDATTTNTAGKIVARDGSGNFAAGTITATATQAQYADLAERYKADADYEAGTLVCIGGEFEITQTEVAQDLGVFGVISTDPAYLMNAEADGLPVALAGRVPVKVIGKVAKGDRLCSSEIPGVAQAYNEEWFESRVVFGRALADKEDPTEGLIEAVIGIK